METLTNMREDEIWPTNPTGYMEEMSKDMAEIVETIEELLATCHGIRLPISAFMKTTSEQNKMFVSNVISGELSYEISTKSSYMQIHSFASILRNYRQQGGLQQRAYYQKVNPPELAESQAPPKHMLRKDGKKYRVMMMATDTEVTDTESARPAISNPPAAISNPPTNPGPRPRSHPNLKGSERESENGMIVESVSAVPPQVPPQLQWNPRAQSQATAPQYSRHIRHAPPPHQAHGYSGYTEPARPGSDCVIC